MQFRAELNYTMQDIRQFQTLHKKQRRKGWYYVLWVYFAVAVLVILVSTAFLFFRHAWKPELTRYFLLLALFLVLWFILRYYSLRAAWKSANSHGCTYVTADENGVHVKAEMITSEFGYASFCNLFHYKGTYYLYIDKIKAQIIPERCFTGGDPAAFGKFIEEKTGLTMKEIK